MKKEGLIMKPKISGDDIVVEMDAGNEEGARRIMNTWGNTFPVIKIDDYVLSGGELVSFEMNVRINSLLTFNMTVDDHALRIRESLKKDLDTCTINIGFKSFRFKFNGLITKTFSDAGSSVIDLQGILWNESLYESVQKCYRDMPLLDVFKDITEKTNMGLYITENDFLTAEHERIINPNMSYLDFFDYLIKKYTENLWCVDPFYHFHIGDIPKLRARCASKDYDMYSLDNTGEAKKDAPLPIILNSYQYPLGDTEQAYDNDDKMIRIEYYTIDTNFSDIFRLSKAEYYKNDVLINSSPDIGMGNDVYNMFGGNGANDGFMSLIFPYYRELVNKLIGGTLIKVSSKNLVIEVTPFDIVDFQCYLPRSGDEPIRKDEEHSGAKIVIGYGYRFEHADIENHNPSITQTLELI